MEKRLKEIIGRLPFTGAVHEAFSPFVERICRKVDIYGMGRDNKETFLKFGDHLLPILQEEGNVVYLEGVGSLKVCGDLHGDLVSLLSFLELCDFERDHLLFLGDYLDKGDYGPQVLLVLFLLKVTLPDRVVLLRGNHERHGSVGAQEAYSFIFKTLQNYDIYNGLLAFLPLACVVNSSVLAVHGMFPPVEDIGRFLREMDGGKETAEFVTWGDVSLDNEDGLCRPLREDLEVHVRKYSQPLGDVFRTLKRRGLSLLVRGHSWVRKGFHAIKCGDTRATNAFVRLPAASFPLSPGAPFLVSLHTHANRQGMRAAVMAISFDDARVDVFQLPRTEEEEDDDFLEEDLFLEEEEEEEEEKEDK